MGIVCAAVVGQQNNPLYIKTLSPVDDEVKFHYMVHASLDAVEEKVRAAAVGMLLQAQHWLQSCLATVKTVFMPPQSFL